METINKELATRLDMAVKHAYKEFMGDHSITLVLRKDYKSGIPKERKTIERHGMTINIVRVGSFVKPYSINIDFDLVKSFHDVLKSKRKRLEEHIDEYVNVIGSNDSTYVAILDSVNTGCTVKFIAYNSKDDVRDNPAYKEGEVIYCPFESVFPIS